MLVGGASTAVSTAVGRVQEPAAAICSEKSVCLYEMESITYLGEKASQTGEFGKNGTDRVRMARKP
jgi:hypothetical protein